MVKNIVNNRLYVGRTHNTLEKRMAAHNRNRNRNRDSRKHLFHNAIRKHGKENFKWYTLKTCKSWEEAGVMETFMIMVHHSHMSEGGYNMTWGNEGTCGYKWTEEQRKFVGELRKGRITWNKGLTKETDDRLKKMSEKYKGHNVTEETKRKISKSKKGKSTGPRPEEVKKKISLAHQGKILGPQTEEHKRKRIKSYKRTCMEKREK